MTEYMLRRLARAAALRARGTEWIEVAKAVNSRPVICRRWPDRYPAEWQALYDEARRKLVEETWALAHRVLAEMAGPGTERVRKRAAGLMDRYGDDLRRPKPD
jgi:hypothetical protein